MAQVSFIHDDIANEWAPTVYRLAALTDGDRSMLFGRFTETDRWEYQPGDESSLGANPMLFTWIGVNPDRKTITVRGKMYVGGRESDSLQVANVIPGTPVSNGAAAWEAITSDRWYGDYFQGAFYLDKAGTNKPSFFVPYPYSEPRTSLSPAEITAGSYSLRFNIVRDEL
jgi:hypothetical protein